MLYAGKRGMHILKLLFRRLGAAVIIGFWGRFIAVRADCTMHNDCNGHGTCIVSTSTCVCYEGWGAPTDVSLYKAPDCSARTCPSGRADIPISLGRQSHVAHASARPYGVFGQRQVQQRYRGVYLLRRLCWAGVQPQRVPQ